MIAFPGVLEVSKLNRECAEYSRYAAHWDILDALAKGGVDIKESIQRILIKRPKELTDVYQQRAKGATYQNILGTVIGWYTTKLFVAQPEIQILPEQLDGFWPEFLQDCTRSGISFVNFWRDVLQDLILFKCSYVLSDLPRAEMDVMDRAQEMEAALDRPYLVRYSPRQVINCECDDYGNLEWILIRCTEQMPPNPFTDKPGGIEQTWYYFDKMQYAVYSSEEDSGRSENAMATLEGSGLHALAAFGRVPVRRVHVPDMLWLGNRAYLQLLDHFNQENSYAWALFMANLAMPVITGPYESQTTTLSEAGFLHLPDTDSKFGWTEPEGKTFVHSAERLAYLREELYRTFYLQSQGRSSSASASAASGYSKELDMAPSHDVLNAFADLLQQAAQNQLVDVADARGEALTVDVRWPTFEVKPFTDVVIGAQAIKDLDIQSSTLDKEMQKRVARAGLADANPELIQQVESEIDKAPTREEQQAAQATQQTQTFMTSLDRAMGNQLAQNEVAA